MSAIPAAFQNQRTLARIKADPSVYAALREIFVQRREQRREQAEAATGEVAIRLSGAARELTTIINEFFPEE